MGSVKIRIPDLLEPVLNPAQRAALDAAEQTPLDLSVDAVLIAASERADLDDFGPDDFVQRLELLLDETGWEGHTRYAQIRCFERMVAKATDRLLTRDLLKQHPEIQDEPIEAPLVVAGLPRSGTTHLLNLIAADSRFQSLPYWEVLRPVPLMPEDQIGSDGIDPRRRRAAAAWAKAQELNPYSASYHPLDPDHISEDGELQLADFASYVWEFSLRAPRWRDYYYAHDQTPHYEYQKLMMQVLQWRRGVRTRWIVKAPQHFEQLRPVLNVFPDAMVVFTHRDPVASLQSILTMRTYSARMREKVIDFDYDMAYWTDRYEHLLNSYLEDVEVVPSAQRFDCLFHEFVGDDLATVARIYQTAGLAMTEKASEELSDYMSSHERGSAGQVVMGLNENFRVAPDPVRERFSHYFDRVPVRVER